MNQFNNELSLQNPQNKFKYKVISLDIETTGLNLGYDEILQLAIINFDGKILFNEKFKPSHINDWPSVEILNQIAPNMVKNCRPIIDYTEEIETILSQAETVIGYNLIKFDLPMLDRSGINTQVINKVEDAMKLYSTYYAQDNFGDDSYKKLSEAGSYFGYFSLYDHDAESDAFMTLNIYKNLKGYIKQSKSTFENLKNDYLEKLQNNHS